jgi:hypothetical protein
MVSATDPYGRQSRFFYTGVSTFLSSSSSFNLTRLSGPRSRPITSQKIWWRQEPNAGPPYYHYYYYYYYYYWLVVVV